MNRAGDRVIGGRYNLHWYCITNVIEISGRRREEFLALPTARQLALAENPVEVESEPALPYGEFPIEILRELCTERELSPTGSLTTLVQRLTRNDTATQSAENRMGAICDGQGNYNISIIDNILGDLRFRYTNYNRGYQGGIPWEQVGDDMENPDFLGFVILKGEGGGHYTAVSGTVTDCWVYDAAGVVIDRQYTYIDSIDRSWICKNKRDLLQYLQNDAQIYVQNLISIFKTPDSHACQAADRLSML
jgi:hypothetical protein